MTYKWKQVAVSFEVSPEFAELYEAACKREEARLFRDLNEVLYPYAGARDEAVARLNVLAGLDPDG
jgi:hypothetical protein